MNLSILDLSLEEQSPLKPFYQVHGLISEYESRESHTKDLRAVAEVKELELSKTVQQMWLIFSDCKFDNPSVCDKIETIILRKKTASSYSIRVPAYEIGPENLFPIGIVFMGDFSETFSPDDELDGPNLLKGFLPSALCNAINRYPSIQEYVHTWTCCYTLLKKFSRLIASGELVIHRQIAV